MRCIRGERQREAEGVGLVERASSALSDEPEGGSGAGLALGLSWAPAPGVRGSRNHGVRRWLPGLPSGGRLRNWLRRGGRVRPRDSEPRVPAPRASLAVRLPLPVTAR